MGNCFGNPPQDDNSSGEIKPSGKSGGSARSLLVPPRCEKETQKSLPPSTPSADGELLWSQNSKAFSLDELKDATRNFLPESLLGQGGFGYVYKGWIDKQTLGAARPESGMAVAVKKLKVQGFQGHKEWLSEVTYLSQLHHPNLVKLIGYCLDGDNRLLVYEFMPKGSLEKHLFQRGAEPLSWAVRVKIAIAAARGLAFLHDFKEQVIYRDFKASNILLDSEFNAKLADFGLAKAGPTGGNTHVSTQVLGTHGYAAPEYIATGQLSARCDVYGFGVVLLEILTGRRAFDRTRVAHEEKLIDWIKPYLGDKQKIFRIMDTKLKGEYSRKGAYMAVVIARQCISEAKVRPPMAEIVELLEKIPLTSSAANYSQSHQGGDSSPAHKTPSRHNHPSPMNRTSK